MNIVIQKTHRCSLSVEDKLISQIGKGLIVFVGVDQHDTHEIVDYMARKISHLRLFKDENDKINKSVLDIGGDVMVVSNFTLNAVIGSGTRPSFSHSAPPDYANELYLELAEKFRQNGIKHVATGVFGAHMHLDTIIDGPFNIVLEKKAITE